MPRRRYAARVGVEAQFLRLREWVAGHAELSAQLAQLERRVGVHDHELKGIIRAIREMVQLRKDVPPRKIGFRRAGPE